MTSFSSSVKSISGSSDIELIKNYHRNDSEKFNLLWKSIFQAVDFSVEDGFNWVEDRFFIVLKKPKRGWVLPVSEEAPGGTVLLLGDTPEAAGKLRVEGSLKENRLTFDQGMALFVKTTINDLSLVNQFLVRTVMYLPAFLRNALVEKTGSYLDKETGSIESTVKIQWIELDGDVIRLKYSLYNDSRDIPEKEYDLKHFLMCWREGTPLLEGEDFREYLRKKYIEQC